MSEAFDYGEVSLESAPADPRNPAWNSLLDCLRAVHEGELPLTALAEYHAALGRDLEARKAGLWASVPAGEDPSGDLALGLGALTVTGLVLDQIDRYLDEPVADRMAACVEMLLQAQAVTRGVEGHLERTSS